MKQSRGYNTQRARALTTNNLCTLCDALGPTPQHDDLLFTLQVLSAVHGLLRSCKLTLPDKIALCDPRKNSLRSSAVWRQTSYGFDLTTSETDKTYKGHKIVILQSFISPYPFSFFSKYVRSRDTLHCGKPELWLKEDGTMPMYSWFVAKLKTIFP